MDKPAIWKTEELAKIKALVIVPDVSYNLLGFTKREVVLFRRIILIYGFASADYISS